MKTAAILSLLAASAAAFAPSSQSGKASSALSADFKSDFGAIKPVSFSFRFLLFATVGNMKERLEKQVLSFSDSLSVPEKSKVRRNSWRR